jgi:hypothetical protein
LRRSVVSFSIWMDPSSGRIHASKTYFAPCTAAGDFSAVISPR